VNDVIFSYNAGNRPESKTTGIFRLVRQLAVTGAKSVVSNCILFGLLLANDDLLYCRAGPASYTSGTKHWSRRSAMYCYKITGMGY